MVPRDSGDGPQVAVIVPTLNEEDTIAACLASVGRDPGVEIVVSDGGSRDRTVEVVRGAAPAAEVVTGPPGRGSQLARGVAASHAPVVLLLHADCRLPTGWLEAVRGVARRDDVALGYFTLHTEPPTGRGAGRLERFWYRLLDLRSFGLGLPYGDQGFVLRRETLAAVGGIPAIPLMEDLALARACRRRGQVVRLPLAIRTTARRFARHPVRARLCTVSFPLLFSLGVSPERLARWYGSGR